MIKIALDAMGGDNAPMENVEGAVKFTNNNDSKVILVGDEASIKNELSKYNFDKNKIEIIHTSQVVDNCEQPTVAIKEKKDSSMVVAINLVKEGRADAVVSAGNTGALLTGATMIIGRIKGIKRPCLGAMIPGKTTYSLLVDAGANIDPKPEYLVQFAKMGSVYYSEMMDKKNPVVGLANIGVEDNKGNELTKTTFPLLKDAGLNFMGNVEVRDIMLNEADVIVSDAFTGNVILKVAEGTGKAFADVLKQNLMSKSVYKIGALLSKGALKGVKAHFDYEEVGGAPFLGLKGLVVKAHGSSNAYAFNGALNQAKKFVERDIAQKISDNIEVNK